MTGPLAWAGIGGGGGGGLAATGGDVGRMVIDPLVIDVHCTNVVRVVIAWRIPLAQSNVCRDFVPHAVRDFVSLQCLPIVAPEDIGKNSFDLSQIVEIGSKIEHGVASQ